MIRWRIPEILAEWGWTAYRLAQETGLTIPAAYRLAKDRPVERIDAATLDTMCRVFGMSPGDLLEYTVGAAPRPKKRK